MSEASVTRTEKTMSGKQAAREEMQKEKRWQRDLWAIVRTLAFTLNARGHDNGVFSRRVTQSVFFFKRSFRM